MTRASQRSKTLGPRQRMTPPPYSGQPLRARYVREYLEHMKAASHTRLTTSDAIYDRMAERSPAP